MSLFVDPPAYTVGSLFSGIGGLDLGMERAGFKTTWFCEKVPYRRKILAQHFPGPQIHHDITTLDHRNVAPVDGLIGGFPCTNISRMGDRTGVDDGAASGLWRDYARLVRALYPRFVFVENVSALFLRGLDRVLGDLAEAGYDAEWTTLSAADVGAPHLRQRIAIVAYRREIGQQKQQAARLYEKRDAGDDDFRRAFARRGVEQWESEPGLARLADGVPGRTLRIAGLGDSAVPQWAEWIGLHIHRFLTNPHVEFVFS